MNHLSDDVRGNISKMTLFTAVDDCSYLSSIRAVIVVIMIVCYISTALALAGSILGCVTTCCAPPVSRETFRDL